jgi:uncharacterized membrane protein YtjA (UPF0391 family)
MAPWGRERETSYQDYGGYRHSEAVPIALHGHRGWRADLQPIEEILFLPEIDFHGFEPFFRPELSFLRRIGFTSGAQSAPRNETQERVMLSWVVTFLIIALVAALLGFGGIAGASIEIAKIVFFVALVLFLISAVVGLARGRGNV